MPAHTLFYDASCRFCRTGIAGLRRLDWFGRFAYEPLTGAAADAALAEVPPAARERAVHCRARGGKILAGADALRFVAMRLPLLAPLTLPFWLPGAMHLARPLYAWVARRRHWISRWLPCDAGCDYRGTTP